MAIISNLFLIQPSILWKLLTCVPYYLNSMAILGTRLSPRCLHWNTKLWIVFCIHGFREMFMTETWLFSKSYRKASSMLGWRYCGISFRNIQHRTGPMTVFFWPSFVKSWSTENLYQQALGARYIVVVLYLHHHHHHHQDLQSPSIQRYDRLPDCQSNVVEPAPMILQDQAPFSHHPLLPLEQLQ